MRRFVRRFVRRVSLFRLSIGFLPLHSFFFRLPIHFFLLPLLFTHFFLKGTRRSLLIPYNKKRSYKQRQKFLSFCLYYIFFVTNTFIINKITFYLLIFSSTPSLRHFSKLSLRHFSKLSLRHFSTPFLRHFSKLSLRDSLSQNYYY